MSYRKRRIRSKDSQQFWGFVKIFPLFFMETRLMGRTGRLRQSRLHSTGRKTCSTMRFWQKATTILRNHSCTFPGSSLGMQIFILLSHLHLLLRKFRLTWLHSNRTNEKTLMSCCK